MQLMSMNGLCACRSCITSTCNIMGTYIARRECACAGSLRPSTGCLHSRLLCQQHAPTLPHCSMTVHPV